MTDAPDFKQRNVPSTFCPYCGKEIQGLLLKIHSTLDSRPAPFYTPRNYAAFLIVACPRDECHLPFYITTVGTCSESSGKVFSSSPQAIWPPPEKKLDDRIPEDVRADFREAYVAWAMRLDRAACLQLRRCLENACLTAGAPEGKLEDMIEELKGQNKIHPMNAVSAHKTRLIGNFTAHVVREITSDEIQKAMRLTEKILEDLFVVPKLQEEIDTARPKKS